MLSSSGQTQADGQPGEADDNDNEDDEARMVCRFGVTPLLFCKVNKLAAQHDQVQGYNGTEVPCALLMSFPAVLPWLSEASLVGDSMGRRIRGHH